MLTGEQIRAAISMLGWSQQILSDKSGINARTLQRMAKASGVPSSNAKSVEVIQLTLEKGDDTGYIEFIDNGVVFHRRD